MLLRLVFGEITEVQELPLTTYVLSILKYIWERRYKVVKPSIYEIQSSPEAKCRLLRESSFLNAATILSELKTYC